MAKLILRAKSVKARLRVCIHRQYTIEEAARAIGKSRATIKRMIKCGLPAITDRRPTLILGEDLADCVRAKRQRQPCALDECFCFKCRKPRKPALGLADFVMKSSTNGNVIALCEDCNTVMNKRVALSSLPALQATLEVSIRQAQPDLSDSLKPTLNEPLHKDSKTHA